MIIFLIISALVQCVVGWGADTHPTIGYLAERFLLNETTNVITAILAGEPDFHGSIGSAANWADKHRTPPTAGWHFVDAEDDPPQSCSVEYNRDCPSRGGCVISALANHTKIFRQCLDDNDVSMECSNALKYLVHFMGDITQPLHCSAKSRGGNQIEVKFGNRRRNLHSCWDTYIPDKIVDLLDPPTFPTWTDQLEYRISSQPDSFLTSPNDWISCIDPKNIEDCAVNWATESNSFTCSFVYGDKFSTSIDLAGEYLVGATPIVETQVAKAALRLAVFLNLLVTSKPGWGEGTKFIVQGK